MVERVYGLVGYPLGHSYSRQFFERLFEGMSPENGRCVYRNFELEAFDLDVWSELCEREQGLRGVNVTIPHKQSAMLVVDVVDPVAQAVGAINCIAIDRDAGGVSCGYNTDVIGFRDSLLEFLSDYMGGDLSAGLSSLGGALVLGDGGAARAVRWVLGQLGVRCVSVVRGVIGNHDEGRGAVVTYDELSDEMIAGHRLIVNTTPLGMFPHVATLPGINYEAVGAGHYMYDLVYNPEVTEFMRRGLERGAKVVGGGRMLELQALAAWEIWNRK